MMTNANPCADNKQLVHRFVDECWNLGKFDSLREMVADDCRLHDPVFPSLTSGVENLKRHIITCRNGFPDLNLTIDDTVAEGDEVVHHWTARGTHRALFLGLQPTNRSVTVSGTSISRIKGCKIVEQWSDWNLLSLLEQLGLAAAPKVEAKSRG
ncbi:MAG TPA: ester cyclase [Edaphobacter sp.]